MLALVLAVPVAGAGARNPVICVNPASGASWEIRIDYDSNGGRQCRRIIAIGNFLEGCRQGNNYTLDRKSGALTQVAPSSTGGYFLHDRCKLS